MNYIKHLFMNFFLFTLCIAIAAIIVQNWGIDSHVFYFDELHGKFFYGWELNKLFPIEEFAEQVKISGMDYNEQRISAAGGNFSYPFLLPYPFWKAHLFSLLFIAIFVYFKIFRTYPRKMLNESKKSTVKVISFIEYMGARKYKIIRHPLLVKEAISTYEKLRIGSVYTSFVAKEGRRTKGYTAVWKKIADQLVNSKVLLVKVDFSSACKGAGMEEILYEDIRYLIERDSGPNTVIFKKAEEVTSGLQSIITKDRTAIFEIDLIEYENEFEFHIKIISSLVNEPLEVSTTVYKRTRASTPELTTRLASADYMATLANESIESLDEGSDKVYQGDADILKATVDGTGKISDELSMIMDKKVINKKIIIQYYKKNSNRINAANSAFLTPEGKINLIKELLARDSDTQDEDKSLMMEEL